ncbi:MAG: hypothetical protein A3F09_05320 [Chlamydiae bacterium RIFCSPHIGHO2_12_FULL_49_11]|nr:MAG: hypothetical protein A3F09_05320 [Chlamydiae bacterium RIFCSPHIGHO2_12_FULL_49_11]
MKWTLDQPITLAAFFEIHFKGVSKRTVSTWIDHGRLTVNGTRPALKMTAMAGDVIEFLDHIQKNPFGLHFYYHDNEIVVVEKPEGLLSVNSEDESVVSLLYLLKKSLKRDVWPVQRLDRETSGVLVFALTQKARERLKKQFEDHTIERTYYAVLGGQLEEDTGVWKTFLTEDKNLYVHVAREGKLAISRFEVVKRTTKTTHVRFFLETGKKNQLRVQADHFGHAIVGDPKYDSRKNLKAKRLLLHATDLVFLHPTTNKKMSFRSDPPFI